MNSARLSWINAAYDKLDKNKDGQVTLDDIAKIIDISTFPEVVNGSKTPKEVYMQYMSCWETQKVDGIVTFEEFVDYYKDVSASVESDEMFAAIMKSAWAL
jgi:Ca2+-binding EF-hand superfamily protein